MVAVFKSVELAEKGWCPMSIPKILFVHEISISRKHFHIFFFFFFLVQEGTQGFGRGSEKCVFVEYTYWLGTKLYTYMISQ